MVEKWGQKVQRTHDITIQNHTDGNSMSISLMSVVLTPGHENSNDLAAAAAAAAKSLQ